jgi:predicted metalloendopeptidase
MKLSRTLLVACAVSGAAAMEAADSAAKKELPDPGFSVRFMDLAVSPAQDFAKFAAGGWYARTQIPADKSRWGGFNELAERNWAILHGILDAAAAAPGAAGATKQKVGDLLAAATHTATQERRGR